MNQVSHFDSRKPSDVCVCAFVSVCEGSEASFIVAVQQHERYPVDLYYLVDVSASMQENLDQVNPPVILTLRQPSSPGYTPSHLPS